MFFKVLYASLLTLLLMTCVQGFPMEDHPIVTAEKFVAHGKQQNHIKEFVAPKIILICYQRSSLKHFLNSDFKIHQSDVFSELYLTPDNKIGILGGWGIGAPALALKMEKFIALGVKQFVAVGTAATLMNKHPIGSYIVAQNALAEDGVSHHYLEKTEKFASLQPKILSSWNSFSKDHNLFSFQKANTWSFSAIFKERPSDILRVTEMGCSVLEMETATFYAIGREKQVDTLALFVISDSVDLEKWTPHVRDPFVRNRLNQLASLAFEFCIRNSS